MKQEPDEPTPADRLTIALALREMAELLAVSGQEPFKARAYLRGAEVLERLDADLGDLVRTRRLTTLPGIGTALAAMITELYESGQSQTLDEQRQRVPVFLRELSRVPRLGVDKIVKLHEALGVQTLEDLETACMAGRVRTLKGMCRSPRVLWGCDADGGRSASYFFAQRASACWSARIASSLNGIGAHPWPFSQTKSKLAAG